MYVPSFVILCVSIEAARHAAIDQFFFHYLQVLIMKPFVFSCDAHIVEPTGIFTDNMPAHLKEWTLSQNVDEKGFLNVCMGDTVLHRIPANFFAHKVGDGSGAEARPKGQRDLSKRFADMARDGIDAELVFPTLTLMGALIPNSEAAVKTAHLYNDWAWDYLEGYRDKLVPAAFLPLSSIDDCVNEIRRVAAKGFVAVMLPPSPPDSVPAYNNPEWDRVFAACADADVTIVSHTATGKVPLKAASGPGGALFNYTRQMNDAIECITLLIGGGVLDRNPKARIMFAEVGAGWLLGLAERMDEVYFGHAPYIQPKLSRLPSQILRDQVYSSFQNDTGCLAIRKLLGLKNMLFASDYPHSEGTFPHTQDVIKSMFDKVPDLTDDEKAAVLGLNAATLFRTSPEQVAAVDAHIKAA
jgi:predicted TIM-barrel fold metal-dependent hydrolase